MLYLVKNLSEAYKKIKDNFKNEKLIIYGIPFGDENIKIDIEKTIEDLKYISLSDKEFYLLELEPKELGKLTELSLEDWIYIFFYFGAENEYSIYSDTLLKEDYKEVISKIQEKYSFEEKKKFFERYILTLGLISIFENNSDSKNLSSIKEVLKNMKFNEEDLMCSIEIFLYKLSKNINFDVSNLLPLAKKVFPISLEKIEKIVEERNISNFRLKNCYDQLIKDMPFFILSLLKEKHLFSFISLFNFLVKPLENISFEDIKTLIKNYERIEIENLRENLKEQYRVSNKNITIEDIEFEGKLFDSIEKISTIHMQYYLEKMYYKFELLKICFIEKVYKYLVLNPVEYEKLKNELKSKNLKYNDLVQVIKNHISINKTKINLENYWGTYLKYYKKLPFKVEKNFYFNDFFRMQLFYRKEIFKILTNIEEKMLEYLGVKNKIRPQEYENLLGSKKGNFNQMKLSQREIGESNYEKIISCYKNNTILEKIPEHIIEQIKEQINDFRFKYIFLQKYKEINNIKNILNQNLDKNLFFRYNKYLGLGNIYDFKIKTNYYKNNVSIFDEIVDSFSYQKKVLNISELQFDGYYVVKLKNESNDIFILQYMGRLENKILFRSDCEIKSYSIEEIEVRKIKSLKFPEKQEQEQEQFSLF